MEISSSTPRPSLNLENATQRIALLPVPTTSVTVFEENQPAPSTIVTLSDHGLERVRQAQLEGIDTYVEKTDEEYAKMSYEELIDERNGGKDANWFLGKGATNGIRIDGKAAHAANVKLGQQQWENGSASLALRHSLDAFTSSVKADPQLSKGNFDISFIDGKPTVISKNLSKESIDKIQKMLDDKKNPLAIKLTRDIAQYNDAALKTINMQIYDEKGRYGGADSIYVHRDDPLSMKEFTDNISYKSVAASEGGYTYQKHSEIIGSTNYGLIVVYKSS